MEAHQKIMFFCPFCEKETLEVLTWPSHTVTRTSRTSSAKGKTIEKKPAGFELLSEKCSNCGKTANEIKRAWKEGIKKTDIEKQKKRIEEIMKLKEELKKEREKIK